MEEILCIDVTITERRELRKGWYSVRDVRFDAEAESRWFRGKAQPGARDLQKRLGSHILRLCADYVLEGHDFTGSPCTIHNINVNRGFGWKPTVSTDSEALAFLNGKCTAVLERRPQGPLVKIYAETNIQ